MSNNIEKKKFPWWIKLLIIVSALPVLTLPMIIGKSSAIQYDDAKMFFRFYPFYVVASTILAWISYRQRPEMTIILILLLWLTHIAMWMLPGAI